MQFDRDEGRFPSVADRRDRGEQVRKVSPRSAAGSSHVAAIASGRVEATDDID
jgi:hypothetical protein